MIEKDDVYKADFLQENFFTVSNYNVFGCHFDCMSVNHYDQNEVSDTERDVRELLTSSPINWSPRNFDCDRVQNLEEALASLPQLAKIEPGRVYDMTPVLNAISDSDTNSERYSRRAKKRHDYKKLHNGQ